eukprot:3855799-Prymnesium_polylepis.1
MTARRPLHFGQRCRRALPDPIQLRVGARSPVALHDERALQAARVLVAALFKVGHHLSHTGGGASHTKTGTEAWKLRAGVCVCEQVWQPYALKGVHALHDVSNRRLVRSAPPEPHASGRQRNKDVRRARIPAAARERECAVPKGLQVGLVGHPLALPLGVHAGLRGDAKLDQKARDHSVQQLAVQKIFLDELDEPVDAERRQRAVEQEDERAGGRRALHALLRHGDRQQEQETRRLHPDFVQ